MSHKKQVDEYIQGVLAGDIVVNKWVRLAVERHVADLETGHLRGLRFDHTAGDHVLDFFGYLKHSKGEWAGEVFKPSPWQMFIVYVLFGWSNEDGTRRFRTALILVARKNGKSTFAAGIALYLLVADGEPGAEVYTCATKKDQAKIVWSESMRMVEASPELSDMLKINKSVSNINMPESSSKLEPLARDTKTLDGMNPHGSVIDELHAHPDRETWDVIETGEGSRRQPVKFAISTAGYSRKGVCHDQMRYGEKILEGKVVDDSYFAFLCGLDEGDVWWDENVWAKSNPNIDISVKSEYLRKQCEQAREMPSKVNAFLTKNLNVWTQQVDRAIDMQKWLLCDKGGSVVDLIGREAFAGLDLSSRLDITALVLVFPSESKPVSWDVLPFFWIPEEAMRERSKRDGVPYDVWVKQGFIRTTPGNVIDYDFIRQDINEIGDQYRIKEIGFDEWGATQITIELEGDGFKVVPMRQGYKTMSPASKELEKVYVGQQLNHYGNPVLNWMAENMAFERDPADNIKPAKNKSEEKIDGMVALIMGLARGDLHVKKGPSVYKTRGVRTL